MPVVAIVGRPNVGKSSLLNALVGKRISIVQDMPGVTRDRVSMPLPIDGRFIEMVDTGGYGYVDPDALSDHIAHQIELAMARADLVLFLVDASTGRTSADEEIAAMLRRRGIKTLLVANKADGVKADAMLGDFARLGLGTPLGVSATADRNLDELLERIAAEVDLENAPTRIPDAELLVAIVGKRNAGKSTLVNAIAGLFEGDPERVIVSEVPGTTRDSVDVRFQKDGKTLIVIDTAGVRKKRHMATNDIEFYSFHRAQRSIRRADVVLMLIDGIEPVSEPDKKLAQYIAEQLKPVILVVNKWDLSKAKVRETRQENAPALDSELMQEFREYLDGHIRNLNFAPIAFITAKDGRNVQGLVDLSQYLAKQAAERVGTGVLNRVIRQILAERIPTTPTGRRARIYYATQTEVSPPTIVLFVNNPVFVDENYQRFMLNRMRELLPYAQVPIKLVVRAREQRALRDEPALDAEIDEQSPPRSTAKSSARVRPSSPRATRPAPRRAVARKRGESRTKKSDR